MNAITMLGTGHVNRDDSAFPTVAKLADGGLACGFSYGGGPEVTGGSAWAKSADGGATWTPQGVILPRDGAAVNTLRLSRVPDGRLVAYGQRNYLGDAGSTKFGTLRNEAVFLVSTPDQSAWGEARTIPHHHGCPLEVANPMLVLSDGRWLAPATLLPSPERMGAQTLLWESCDEGRSWAAEYPVLSDPAGKMGFFEQKIIETSPGELLAFAWAVELGSYRDRCNHYAFSKDGGRTWSAPVPTSIPGQTLSPLWLGGDRFLLVYNHRRPPQGVKLASAVIRGHKCEVSDEGYLWEPCGVTSGGHAANGIDGFDDFAFGLPSLTQLDDGAFLAVFWCKEDGGFGVRWAKFALAPHGFGR